ncbi:MAG: DNA polymerase III subunit beta [Clostridia bacterium]|nr:DNA polymerase III subunit beta [Clostridia bacterium]
MNIVFDKSVLCEAVAPLMGAVSSKNTLAAVEGILITTEGSGKCSLTSFDLDKGFYAEIDAKVEEEGSFIINGTKFNQIIRMLPEGDIRISVDNRFSAKITGGKSEFELNALGGEEFPSIPEFKGDYKFTLHQGVLRSMIADTVFAVAQNESKAVLNGCFFDINENTLKVVACDGNRLAVRAQVCEFVNESEGGKALNIRFILPGKAITELQKNLKDNEDDVTVSVSRKNAVFEFEDYTFFTRLIEGEYLEYERFIPKESKIFVKIDTEQYIRSLERASLVSEDKSMGQARSYVKCSFCDDALKITSTSANGRSYDEIAVQKEGADIEIGFNCRFLLDALRACGTEEVMCALNTPLSCMVITPSEKQDDGDYLYLVLPIRMKE